MKKHRRTYIPRIGRMAVRVLVIVAVLLALVPGQGTRLLPAGPEMPLSEAGGGASVFSKNNATAAPVQEPAALTVSKAPAAERTAVSAVVRTSASAARTAAVAAKPEQKTVYLTFDDGPSNITPKVLDILREERVKATFFVLGEQAKARPELINAIWEQGHAIGNHTYNHEYKELYSSFTVFWDQIKRTEEVLRLITGERPQMVRAPGGTYGHFDKTYFSLLKQAGYTVMDWTVDSGDSARRGVPAAEILHESLEGLGGQQVILLLHDGAGHGESAKALPEIIARYRAAGYTFGVLDESVKPVQFRVSASAEALHRTKPSDAWIAGNIARNAALFAPGKPLVLETGLQEARLEAGEYSIRDNRYMVPLRAVIERLGGTVVWDAAARGGRVEWNGRTLFAGAVDGELTLTLPGGEEEVRSGEVQLIGSALWVPLRELLASAGYPALQASVSAEERRVVAQR